MPKPLLQITRSLVVLAVALCAAVGAWAQDMSYVQIPGVPGESDDASHVDWIEVWGIDHGAVVPGGGGAVFSDFAFLKGTDKSTPMLYLKLGQQVNLGTVVGEVCRIGPPQECYFRVELINTRITSIGLAGSSCVDPATSCTPSQTESVTLAYQRIQITYTEWQNGNPLGDVEICWDIITNTSC